MSLFPKCQFRILTQNGNVTSGQRFEGVLELVVPEPIPRAEHVDLFFRSHAWAGYGGGKNRTVVRRDVFHTALHVDLPVGQPLPAGTFHYPFAIDLPPWVPPSFAGNDCAIENLFQARLDVDWAVDPVSEMRPVVVLPAAFSVASPVSTRSPLSFHDSIVLEVTLESSSVVHGQPIIGRIALRSGHEARFDAVVLSLASIAHVVMGRGDLRWAQGSPPVRIPAGALRHGEPVPFHIDPYLAIPSTFRSDFLGHGTSLKVVVDIPWASDPQFEIPIEVLPPGSTLYPSATSAAAVGSERLRMLSTFLAHATGLQPARLPTLVEGAIGNVGVRLTDSPRAGRVGLDVDLTFPDVELDATFRPLGMLEGFRQSPHLPEPLRAGYLLRFEPSMPIDDAALAGFTEVVLGGLGNAEEVRFSDHHVGFRVPLTSDGSEQLEPIAHFACAKAKAIGDAIARLPFPASLGGSAAAWHATAAEQGAVLVPTGPSLHRLVFRSRILGGEERALGASIRTTWRKDGPVTIADLDLRGMPLPTTALEGDTLAGVRAVFPDVHAPGAEHVVLERPGFTADPRSLFVGIEAFFAWLLDRRGERRADAPYR